MKFFYIKNHSSHELLEVGPEELLSGFRPKPEISTKDEFRKWCADKETDHCFYTTVEPEHVALRPSKDNQPRMLHGIVADYDGNKCAELLGHMKTAIGKVPTYSTVTFSGNARLVWEFERPIPMFLDGGVYQRFLHLFSRDFGVEKLLPGLDRKAWLDPFMVYELGTAWQRLPGAAPVPHSTLLALLHEASKQVKWEEVGDQIPLEAVAAEIEKRWPGRWNGGDFVEGARGLRFWDPKADNPTGCVVRPGGVQAFTGEGRFLPWSHIFGRDWVQQFKAEKYASAVSAFYHDGQNFWSKLDGVWCQRTTEAARRSLAVKYALKAIGPKGQPSEIDEVLCSIEETRRICGAFPFLFNPDATVRLGGDTYLNISTARVSPSAGTRKRWGEDFPHIAALVDQLFDTPCRRVFLSWLHRFYVSAKAGKLSKGHALFIAGPSSAGKSFLAHRIIGALLGGSEEATSFILGKTHFSADLFRRAVWTIDDAEVAADEKSHDLYSQVVKKVVANFSLPYAKKFGSEHLLPWVGRLVVTLNDDPMSIQMLVGVEASMIDKVLFLKARATTVNFADYEAKVARELPAFASFLEHWDIPAELRTIPSEVARFGFDHYQHPDLLSESRSSSSTSSTAELLDMWRRDWFAGPGSGKDVWDGPAGELMRDMLSCEGALGEMCKRAFRSNIHLGRELKRVMRAQSLSWLTTRVEHGYIRYLVSKP